VLASSSSSLGNVVIIDKLAEKSMSIGARGKGMTACLTSLTTGDPEMAVVSQEAVSDNASY
jgi:hypothetical protein